MPGYPSNPILTNYAPTATIDPNNPTIPARPGRQAMVIQVVGATDVYVGDKTVTAAGGANPGILVKAGQTVPTSIAQSVSTGPLWFITASGTGAITVLEWA